MKICLIDPPISSEDLAGDTKSMKAVLNLIPSLGLAYIAAILEKDGHAVKIIDCTLGISYAELNELLKKEKPDLVGITGSTPGFTSMKKVAEDIKTNLPYAYVVAGGAHLTAAPEWTMQFECFDAGVIGEGELTFLELAHRIGKNGPGSLDNIDGIIYREDGRIVRTKPREFIKDLDSLPFPARHLQPPLRVYKPTPASYRQLPLGVLITTRGCPSRCVFCDRAVFGTSYRERSADNVIQEIEEVIYKFGAREVRFFDDTFTLNEKRVFQLCATLKERKIRLLWTCLTKVNNVSQELLRAMKGAGCWQVLYGLESGDERILKLLNKGNTVAQNERAVRLAQKAGLSVRADFIVGTPAETVESLRRTLDFAIKLKLDYAHFNKFVPYPGTELYRQLNSRGYNFDFRKRCSIIDHSAILFVPESMSKDEFREYLDYANKAFYLRPKYILKRLLSIKSLSELRGQISGFFAIYNLG